MRVERTVFIYLSLSVFGFFLIGCLGLIHLSPSSVNNGKDMFRRLHERMTASPRLLFEEPAGRYSEDLVFYHSIPSVTEGMSVELAEENFHNFVTRRSVDCLKSVRLGNIGDGGWDVCIATPFKPQPPCKVYSFGINYDWSFDDAISEKFSCIVRAFDPSMKNPSHQRSNKVWFYHIGIGGTTKTTKDGWKLKTMIALFKEHNDTGDVVDYLKMDVEGYEWEALESMLATNALRNVKQLGFEIHLNKEPSVEDYLKYYETLKWLEVFGFRRWYWHANPVTRYISKRTNKERHDCYELVYINVHSLK